MIVLSDTLVRDSRNSLATQTNLCEYCDKTLEKLVSL